MTAYIIDGIRTPFGRYGGALASVRADDLAAAPIRALMQRNPGVQWAALDDVLLGHGKHGRRRPGDMDPGPDRVLYST